MDLIFIFFIGLSVGSFTNVLIDRLPENEDIISGRSHCDHCKKTLRWFELIPIISFLIQFGRCRRCRKKLSFQYPLVEFCTAVSYVLLFLNFNSSITTVLWMSVFSITLAIVVTDLKTQIIPDQLTLMLCMIAVLHLVFYQNRQSILWTCIAAVLAASFFFWLWFASKGKVIGFGDVKLVPVLALLTGFPRFIVLFYTAFLTGAVWGVILILLGRKSLKSKVAFGPFLLLGMAIALVFGDYILSWWRNFI